MKRIQMVFVQMIMLCLMLVSGVCASTLTATFSYPVEAEKDIVCFRMTRDGVVEMDRILKTIRTFLVQGPTDQKDHTYVLIAVGNDGQLAPSTPYLLKYVPPPVPKPLPLPKKPTYFKLAVPSD